VRRKRTLLVVLVALGCAMGPSCKRAGEHEEPGAATSARRPHVVVGTSMIECAVRRLAGSLVEVHRLAPPGQCPGHFDMKPGDFEAIARSELLLRHDYQKHLDSKLQNAGGNRTVVSLTTSDPQTVPDNYLALCRQVKEALSTAFPALSPTLDANLRKVEAQVGVIGACARERAKPLGGRPVVASSFQKGFCEWLGLKVVAQFDLEQEMSPRDLESVVRAGEEGGATAVVCNLQRGEREGKPIAERLDVPLVVLSNFPLEPASEDAYAGLLAHNVDRLLEALAHVPDHQAGGRQCVRARPGDPVRPIVLRP